MFVNSLLDTKFFITWKWGIIILICDSHSKEDSPAMQETQVRSLVWEDPTRERNGYPLQYSCLGNSIDGASWRAIVLGVAKNRTQLSD